MMQQQHQQQESLYQTAESFQNQFNGHYNQLLHNKENFTNQSIQQTSRNSQTNSIITNENHESKEDKINAAKQKVKLFLFLLITNLDLIFLKFYIVETV